MTAGLILSRVYETDILRYVRRCRTARTYILVEVIDNLAENTSPQPHRSDGFHKCLFSCYANRLGVLIELHDWHQIVFLKTDFRMHFKRKYLKLNKLM